MIKGNTVIDHYDVYFIIYMYIYMAKVSLKK